MSRPKRGSGEAGRHQRIRGAFQLPSWRRSVEKVGFRFLSLYHSNLPQCSPRKPGSPESPQNCGLLVGKLWSVHRKRFVLCRPVFSKAGDCAFLLPSFLTLKKLGILGSKLGIVCGEAARRAGRSLLREFQRRVGRAGRLPGDTRRPALGDRAGFG